MAASGTGGSKLLKEYLKRYESGNVVEERKKKKKKGKKPDANPAVGVVVVDEDPVWQKPVNLHEESDESADEEKPQVDEDIEVRRMKRLEQLRLSRPYNAIADDGSGWVLLDPIRESSKQISDMSPPRKPRARNDTPSPEPEAKLPPSDRDDDLSPPRQRRNRRDTPSPEPEAKLPPSDRDDDLSPPRQRRNRRDTPLPKFGSERVDSDLSPPHKRRARNDSPSPEHEEKPKRVDADLSPPRQQRKCHYTPSPERGISSSRRGQRSFSIQDDMSAADDLDLSPPRKRRNDVGGPGWTDFSPSRKRRTRNDSPSPERKMKPTRVDTDLSPPRQQRKRHHTPRQRDISVPQRASQTFSYRGDDMRASDLDLSPPRKKRNDSGGPDLSPPGSRRRPTENDMTRASLDPDLSPPRKSQKEDLFSAPSKMPQRTGLISAVDIRNELSKAKADNTLRFKEMDPSLTGQGVAGVYRDKIKGVRISKDEYLKSKQKKEEKPKEIKLEWGKGLAQKREAEARLQELELEKDKPFARTRDDPELDKMLKDRLRWGDPMAHLVKKKHHEPVLPDLGDNEKMKESGFIIPQDIPSHSWIKRGLDAAPNRYGIRPGRHWDGVDRSNGYERQMFSRMNEKQATEREAYLWSVSDM